MGLFSFLNKSSESKDKLVDWLETVDQAYSKSFQVKNATSLGEYLTRPCLVKQMERIRVGEKAYAGLDRYKHVKWEKQAPIGESLVYLKIVTYDQVKMSRGIVAPVGEAYNERWCIIQDNGKYKVAEIRRI